MDCKNALVESNGDFEKAIDILRKKGQKIAAKRADRSASEGVVISTVNSSKNIGIIVSLNCETDFVAKNEEFQDLANKILDISFDKRLNSIDDILQLSIDDNSVEQHIVNLIGKIGEKIELREFKSLEGEKIVPYIHAGNKLGVLVALSGTESVDYVTAGKDIAMQIAAMNPIALNSDEVDQSVVDKEIEIGKEQALKEGKPENIIEKIAQGKLQKFFKENTLLSQSFVKDNSKSVKGYLESFSPELTVTSFLRVSIG